MNIHEYQGKDLLAKYGVAVPRGGVAYTADEARQDHWSAVNGSVSSGRPSW